MKTHSALNPGLPLRAQPFDVRTVNPDTLHKPGFPSREAAQAWIARRGKVAAFAYYVAPSFRQ